MHKQCLLGPNTSDSLLFITRYLNKYRLFCFLPVADEGIDEEDPDYADDTEDEDEPEDYMENDQEGNQ